MREILEEASRCFEFLHWWRATGNKSDEIIVDAAAAADGNLMLAMDSFRQNMVPNVNEVSKSDVPSGWTLTAFLIIWIMPGGRSIFFRTLNGRC